ncbi:DUF1850 domain-containing protein [Shewanella fodinae]|jgi:hypothetical protein|uniref:DUF1850 domain-containing protein n=1 Tax=Shewanella fodinae TaxID=552357 RepID=UPI001671929C|nr:DUF1850 domain-containing protein [Shewanella fodinae]MCL2906225.1 DUF1850 domain-containing protein [Shewanella fodinae]GGY99310.1 hypothetical protein GCM10007169_15400 [Shewanella fodinae]
MLGLCLGLAGQLWASVPQPEFTLGWRHTVEKIRWEEDYNVTPQGLQLTQARVKGTGAGMEIPDGAVFRDDSWHYYEKRPPIPLLKLGRAPEGGDYDICFNGQCQPMSHWIGKPNYQVETVELWPCELPLPRQQK